MKNDKKVERKFKKYNQKGLESFEKASTRVLVLTYIGWAIIFVIGHVKDFLLTLTASAKNPEKNRKVLAYIRNTEISILRGNKVKK